MAKQSVPGGDQLQLCIVLLLDLAPQCKNIPSAGTGEYVEIKTPRRKAMASDVAICSSRIVLLRCASLDCIPAKLTNDPKKQQIAIQVARDDWSGAMSASCIGGVPDTPPQLIAPAKQTTTDNRKALIHRNNPGVLRLLAVESAMLPPSRLLLLRCFH
jgi:hypothetical protein